MTYRQWRDNQFRRVADECHVPLSAVVRLHRGNTLRYYAPYSIWRWAIDHVGAANAEVVNTCIRFGWTPTDVQHNLGSVAGLCFSPDGERALVAACDRLHGTRGD